MIEKTKQRDRVYSITLWVCVPLFAIMQILMVAAYYIYDDNQSLSLAFFVIGYSALVLGTFSISTLLFIGQFKFYRVVKSLKGGGYELATKTVIAITSSLTVWTIVIFLEEILFISDYNDITSYKAITQTTRITTATVYIDLALFGTLAYMLFKLSSGKVHTKRVAEGGGEGMDKAATEDGFIGDSSTEEMVIETSNRAEISEEFKSPISARDPSRRAASQKQVYKDNRNPYMRSENSLSFKSPQGVESPKSNQEFDYNHLTVRQDVRKLYG